MLAKARPETSKIGYGILSQSKEIPNLYIQEKLKKREIAI